MALTATNFELVRLKSGQHSIRSCAYNETMHIGSGPRTEAFELHVRQQQLVERARQQRASGEPFVIWDVGLGPGGNALTALEALRGVEAPVELHSFEVSTEILEFALDHVQALDYMAGWEASLRALLDVGVAFPLPGVRWQLHRGDFFEQLAAAPSPHAIFHDPYSPARNPEMWSLEVFAAMRVRVESGNAPCTLTNYTRSTAVRVTLALAGWAVGLGVSTGDKDQTTIAASSLGLLERPLDRAWLSRVRASTNAAPFRNRAYAPGPISPEDFARLEALGQFSSGWETPA